MLTLFTTAKPFRGHFGVIQRNALKSWTLLHPDVEIILLGEEEGYAEAAHDLGLRHVPDVAKNKFGTILVSGMFERAQALASHDLLCYVNCDIVLLPDFLAAFEAARSRHARFLMVGRRWDTDITEPLSFANPGWQRELRERALLHGRRRTPDWIDYFAFSRGTYGVIPDFAVGRTCWDQWLVWTVAASGHPVIDASSSVVAVHQNHDYRHHPGGYAGAWFGPEAARNRQLAGSLEHFFTIAHATHRLVDNEVQPKPLYRMNWAWWSARRAVLDFYIRSCIAWQNFFWHPFLNATRPLRSTLGLRKAAARTDRKT